MTKISLQDAVKGLPTDGDREIKLPSGNIIKIEYREPVFPKNVVITSDQLTSMNNIPALDLSSLESEEDGKDQQDAE